MRHGGMMPWPLIGTDSAGPPEGGHYTDLEGVLDTNERRNLVAQTVRVQTNQEIQIDQHAAEDVDLQSRSRTDVVERSRRERDVREHRVVGVQSVKIFETKTR